MKYLSFKQKLFTLFTYAAYIVFLFLLIYILLFIESSISKWAFVFSGIFALFVSLLSEYLKRLYNKSLFALNFKLDSDEAVKIFDKLQKYDFFNGYKHSRKIFDLQVYLFNKDAESIINSIANNQIFFRSDVNMLLINYYYLMRAYLIKRNYTKIKSIYPNVQEIRNMKRPPRLFSFDEIDGIHYLALKKNQRAFLAFKNVNMQYMNPKEQIFILENLSTISEGAEKHSYEQEISRLMRLFI